jgi:hypothetical protein
MTIVRRLDVAWLFNGTRATNRVKISVTLVDHELDRMGLCQLDAPPGPHSCGMRLPA